MKLTKEEIQLLISLVEAHKVSVGFLRGFAGPSEADQEEVVCCDNLIRKLRQWIT